LIIFRNNVKYLNIFYIFKIFIEKFGTKWPICLILLYQSAEQLGNSFRANMPQSSLKQGFLGKRQFTLAFYSGVSLYTLWGDEIFGRHALSSRGWGSQDKRSIEPTLPLVRPTRVDH
jgi:hypothetical protein